MSNETTPAREFDFAEWLAAGTVAQRTVELHRNRDIPDRIAVLDKKRRIAEAVAERAGDERSITDEDEVAAINAEIDELLAEWEAGKETWVMRALGQDEIEAINERHPTPPMPTEPSKNSPPGARVEYDKRLEEWAEAVDKIRAASNLDYLATAIVRLETSAGVTHHVTVDQLKELAKIPGRQKDVAILVKAATDAVTEDVELPAPFSRRTSGSTPS